MKQKNKIIGIMAATQQGVISYRSVLPWSYPEELEHFRTTTIGHIMIMGRKTYDIIAKTLSTNREIIVFSRNPHFVSSNAKIVTSLNEFLQYIQSLNSAKKLFMIGGAEIAHLFLKYNLISYFILTKIHHLYSGDTSIDLSYFKGWDEKILKKHSNYTICKLTNIKELS
ncbi:dihydrofolate reductase [Candidatus Tisiphia endosymbiont of Hybos culiciformis]|uniref:dihydrofolate reductase n=1 Tax=Candidatus Tisiphia endosymbiont of Hybos culiciformis TaxID=3139331 RepID=UPI003CCA8F82